jgi:hypothetical protein
MSNPFENTSDNELALTIAASLERVLNFSSVKRHKEQKEFMLDIIDEVRRRFDG